MRVEEAVAGATPAAQSGTSAIRPARARSDLAASGVVEAAGS
jgi:hypothetical protein